MPNRRDLNQELFGGGIASAEPASKGPPREISLSELADLSELTEEQAKVRVKVTHLSTQVEALSDNVDQSERRLDKHKAALQSTVGQVERLSSADDLHSQQLGTLNDSLRHLESHLEAQRNAIAFLRNSDGQQQQTIERLKQSRITLTHILLFGILLCAGSAITLDVDQAFNFHKRLNRIEYRLRL